QGVRHIKDRITSSKDHFAIGDCGRTINVVVRFYGPNLLATLRIDTIEEVVVAPEVDESLFLRFQKIHPSQNLALCLKLPHLLARLPIQSIYETIFRSHKHPAVEV